MTKPDLRWSYAERSDLGELQCFQCAEPAPRPNANTRWRRVPPRPWESQAEKAIRRLGVSKHNRRQGERVLIGRDGSGIACVIAWEWDGDMLYVNVVGVAMRARGAGHGYSAALVEAVFSEGTAEALERGHESVWVTASIHQSNSASEAFARRYGLGPVGDPDEDGMRIWTAEIDVSSI